MDCKQVREVLDLYVNGELSASAAAATSLHLAACEKASTYVGVVSSPFLGRPILAQLPRRLQLDLEIKF